MKGPVVLNHPDEDVRLFFFTRKEKFECLNALKEMNCEFKISVKDQAVVMAHDVFQSLKEFMS